MSRRGTCQIDCLCHDNNGSDLYNGAFAPTCWTKPHHISSTSDRTTHHYTWTRCSCSLVRLVFVDRLPAKHGHSYIDVATTAQMRWETPHLPGSAITLWSRRQWVEFEVVVECEVMTWKNEVRFVDLWWLGSSGGGW